MSEIIKRPKIFISYSWSPAANKLKTLELAERLSNDGIHVIIDEWNLSEGQDKYQFMEKMVNDEEIIRVLIICNKDYTEKANSKKGGVGTESLIISDEMYKSVEQKKFVPVIFEKDESQKPYMPTLIKTRIYFDLSEIDQFENEYEKLIRNIFQKPHSKRPPIGAPPAYIFDEDPVYLGTANKVKTIKNALINENKNVQVFINDYYLSFINALQDFEIPIEKLSKNRGKEDDIIIEQIERLKHLRNDFIDFLEVIFTFSHNFDNDKFFSFFENLIEYFVTKKTDNYSHHHLGSMKSDQFRFFYYELFIYTIAVMWKKERFSEIRFLLFNKYIVNVKESRTTNTYSFSYFNIYINSIDSYRNKRLSLGRKSVVADIIKERANISNYSFEFLQEIDIVLHYISLMTRYEEDLYWGWTPYTSVYDAYYISILDKLVSKRNFDKVKTAFNVNTVQELRDKIDIAKAYKKDGSFDFTYRFPSIEKAFKLDKIASI